MFSCGNIPAVVFLLESNGQRKKKYHFDGSCKAGLDCVWRGTWLFTFLCACSKKRSLEPLYSTVLLIHRYHTGAMGNVILPSPRPNLAPTSGESCATAPNSSWCRKLQWILTGVKAAGKCNVFNNYTVTQDPCVSERGKHWKGLEDFGNGKNFQTGKGASVQCMCMIWMENWCPAAVSEIKGVAIPLCERRQQSGTGLWITWNATKGPMNCSLMCLVW